LAAAAWRSSTRQYQVIIQFLEQDIRLSDLHKIEDTLIAALEPRANVDGHDFGSGTANIFVYTHDPQKVLARVLKALERAHHPAPHLVAYRAVTDEELRLLWPTGYTGKIDY
jgi:hypothetical protein